MILQGNSIRIPLKDESVHAVVTSFPYYGLRSYDGVPPTVWGGDSSCPHVWGDQLVKKTSDNYNNGFNERYGHSPGQRKQEKSSYGQIEQGQFCQLCGAWRGCFGLEPSISLHIQNAVLVCREIKRVLMKTGVFWLNYGDSYSTSRNGRSAADTKAVGKDDRTFRDKPFSVTELPAKNLCLIPFRVALALQDDGWIVRSDIIWSKNNPMPESVIDRPTKSHEYIFMLVKSPRYFYDAEAIRERAQDRPFAGKEAKAIRPNDTDWHDNRYAPGASGYGHHPNGRNKRSVWEISTEPYPAAHYATFPRKLVEPMILAATSARGVCPECGKQWERVIEKEVVANGAGRKHIAGGDKTSGHGWEGTPRATLNTTTTGWQPTCKCIQKRAPNFGMKGSELLELADEVARELAPIGAIVLDPFAGSGTVGAVCRELGRRFIGIDLSAKYLAENALPRSEKKMSRKSLGQLPMFAKLDEAA